MRTDKSIKNIMMAVFTQIVMTALGFFSRKVFVDSLGVQYLGVNGLLTNVIGALALVESGIGASIVYQLYKPLAEKDTPKIIAFIQLYKKAYTIIAVIVLALSLTLLPFLGSLMKGSESVEHITLAYFIFVAQNMVVYLNAHRVALINADQNGYVIKRINLCFNFCISIIRIIILMITKNYILSLSIELLVSILNAFYLGKVVGERYPYIKTKEKYSLETEEKNKLIKNVKAMFFHNIGDYCVFGTDNILMSSFIGIATVGIYSNYSMIIDRITSLVGPIIGEISASVGNLVATESVSKNYSVFKIAYLLNFWVYSLCVVLLYNLLQPFINWWLGNGYLLDRLTFIIILTNFYITGLRASIGMFKSSAGIFVQDKYVPLIESAINLFASMILAKYLGLVGIFLGTLISTLATVFWNVPRLVYKHVFKMPVWTYFKTYLFYCFLTLTTCIITTTLNGVIVKGEGFISLVEKGIICLIIPNAIFMLIFFKTIELKHTLSIFKSIFMGLKKKLVSAA